MSVKRHGVLATLFVWVLFIGFSETVHAMGNTGGGKGIYIEPWSMGSDYDDLVISFEVDTLRDELVADIQVENLVHDDNGSTRFQLSHTGPLSRQVFANVHRVRQDDGFTRTVITNNADGQQIEYLSRTGDLPEVSQGDIIQVQSSSADLESKDGQKTECLTCGIAYLVYKVACARSESNAFKQCRNSCENSGGVGHFEAGECGVIEMECICRVRPPREADEF